MSIQKYLGWHKKAQTGAESKQDSTFAKSRTMSLLKESLWVQSCWQGVTGSTI